MLSKIDDPLNFISLSVRRYWHTHLVSCQGDSLVEHCQAWLVFGWMTVFVCQFSVAVFRMRLYTEALGASLEAAV